nr:tyrosine-type recombinase/integrase [Halochromatium glycolicum]
MSPGSARPKVALCQLHHASPNARTRLHLSLARPCVIIASDAKPRPLPKRVDLGQVHGSSRSVQWQIGWLADHCQHDPCEKKYKASACLKSHLGSHQKHDLRHTCAAWLVQAGVPMAEVRDVLGHCTLAMTERYAHLAPENLRTAVAHLDRSKSRLSHARPEPTKEAS